MPKLVILLFFPVLIPGRDLYLPRCWPFTDGSWITGLLNQGSRSSFDHHLYDILFKNSSIGKSSQEIDSDITHMSCMVWTIPYGTSQRLASLS